MTTEITVRMDCPECSRPQNLKICVQEEHFDNLSEELRFPLLHALQSTGACVM